MSLCKWICFLGGLILIGWPATVNCESSSEDKQPPGVKECRVHIEKALEQYWDKKEPEKNSNPTKDIETNYLDESNFNKEKISRTEDIDTSHLDRLSYTTKKKEISNEENGKDDIEADDNDDVDTKEILDDDDAEAEDDKDTVDEDDSIDDEASDDEENIIDEQEDEDEEEEEDDLQDTDVISDNTEEDAGDEREDSDDAEEEAEYYNENKTEEMESKYEDNNDDEDDDEDEDEDDSKNDEKFQEDNVDEQNVDEIESTASSIPTEASLSNDEDLDKQEDENDGNETNPSKESIENEEHLDSNDITESEENVDETSNDEDEEQESETYDDEKDDESETAKKSLDESYKKESDSIQTEQSVESAKATDKAPEEKILPTEETVSTKDTSEAEEEMDDDSVENIYEEEEEEHELHSYRSREHVDIILGTDEIGAGFEKEEEKMAQSVYRDIKKVETTHIKPVELLYKYADSTTRVLGDAEIFSKPIILFLGPWGAGKTSIINYLLGLERTPAALKTGSTGLTDVDFTLLTYGAQRRIVSGTELVADWKYAGVQKFGQGFLDHFRSIHIPHPLLQKVTIIDTPGIMENRKNAERGYSLNAVFQWFIDRADAIYVVLDPSKVDIGGELGSVIEQLQGQNVRFLLNKADSIRRSDLMRVVGQLFWNLSPLLGGTEAPLIYAVSLTSHPYHPSAPAKFLIDQEKNFLYDIKSTLEKQVENKILYARKHAVRVRNHAKMVDCYLASYYRHKSIFSNKRNIAKLITENPKEYSIYDGLTSMTNVSRSDIPNPLAYKEFFKIHPLYDFKPLASTCSYFRGCPMDKVDLAITKEFPELLAKYKEAKRALYGQLEQKR